VPPPPIPLQLAATTSFTGPMQAPKIILRGALLQIVTFGIYRFWLTTDARHFLWANTEIGGDSLNTPEPPGAVSRLPHGDRTARRSMSAAVIGSLELGVWSSSRASAH
jgi:hypothetical protein